MLAYKCSAHSLDVTIGIEGSTAIKCSKEFAESVNDEFGPCCFRSPTVDKKKHCYRGHQF